VGGGGPHASASGTGPPLNDVPGAASTDSDIFVARVGDLLDHGTGRTNLTNSPDDVDYDPDWSPDGTRLAFMCRPDPLKQMAICVMNADGTGRKQLTDGLVFDATPVWSPDGRRILFGRQVAGPGTQQLFVMNADGTGLPTQLTAPPGVNLSASWGVLRVTAP